GRYSPAKDLSMGTAIGQCAAFPRFTAEQLACAATIGEPVRFSDGEPLFLERQRDVPMYVIRSAEVVVRESSTGAPRYLVTHQAGEFTGDVDLLTSRPIVVSAYAKGPVEAYRIPQSEVRRLLNEIPVLSDMLLEAFQTRRAVLEAGGFLGVRLIGRARS